MKNVFFAVVAAIIFVTTGCGSQGLAKPSKCVFADSVLPTPTGDYCVGVSSQFDWIDQKRPETITPEKPDAKREIAAQIWYPADPGTTGIEAPYMDDATANQTMDTVKTYAEIIGISTKKLEGFHKKVHPHGMVDVPMSGKLPKYPVLLFFPGSGSVYQQYVSFLEDAASNGYVVVAVNHPYFSGLVIFNDGHKVEFDSTIDRTAFIKKYFDVLPADASFALDMTIELNSSDPSGRFRGRLDLSRVGAFGHSLGGATAVSAARSDSRIAASINIDGNLWGQVSVDYVTEKPIMHILSQNSFSKLATVSNSWNRSDTGYFAELSSTGHMNYSDIVRLCSKIAPSILDAIPQEIKDLVGIGSINPEIPISLARTYTAAFFNVYLRGESLAPLLATSSRFENVTFMSSRPPHAGTEKISGPGAIGAGCATNDDCATWFCVGTSSTGTLMGTAAAFEVPGGYCSSLAKEACTTETGGAPINLGILGAGYIGFDLCALPCTVDGDCRAEDAQSCFDPQALVNSGRLTSEQAQQYFGDKKYCLPQGFQDLIRKKLGG